MAYNRANYIRIREEFADKNLRAKKAAEERAAELHAKFPDADLVWATVGFVVLLSVVVHGVAATPVMQWLDRTRERTNSPETVHN